MQGLVILTTLVNLAHAGTEPGLDEAFDPVGLPGDWWIRTLPCTQEAVVLCGMNDCGQRGIEGTAQAQREEAHSSCGQGRHAAGARVGGAARVGAAEASASVAARVARAGVSRAAGRGRWGRGRRVWHRRAYAHPVPSSTGC